MMARATYRLQGRNSADTLAIPAGNGAFLPTGCKSTRITADRRSMPRFALDSRGKARNMDSVVTALPLGALFASLFRYPSPFGRRYAMLRRPSSFSLSSMLYQNFHRTVQSGRWRRFGFDVAQFPALKLATNGRTEQSGISMCDAGSELRHSYLADCPPATRSNWHRSCWEQARAWAQQPFWMAILRPVLSSGPRATCFTATPGKGDVRTTKSQSGNSAPDSHRYYRGFPVYCRQWGASNQRDAEYEHYPSFTTSVAVGGVFRPRGIEPHGLRSLQSDTDHQLTGPRGCCRVVSGCLIALEKRMPRFLAGYALFRFQMKTEGA